MSDTAEPVRAASVLLERALGDRLQRDVPLGPRTTYRVGGPASLFVEAASLDDLAAVASARRLTGVPVLVIGLGSNMLVADDGFDGLVVSIGELASQIDIPEIDDGVAIGTLVEVRAGGGVPLPVLARRTVAAGLRGFEWAVGVPGSVGGGVRMNAGGHGSDMAACLVDVTVVDLDHPSDEPRRVEAVDLGLRFRASALPPSMTVLDARLALRIGDRSAAEAELAEIVRWRRENQPGGQNCGSVFVNPVPGEVTSGGLIDALGLRGFRIGTAHVSDKHANFIQADDGGSAADVRAVIEAVRERVAAATGYTLRSEVRLVGFDDVDPSSFEEYS